MAGMVGQANLHYHALPDSQPIILLFCSNDILVLDMVVTKDQMIRSLKTSWNLVVGMEKLW